jgi:hypothetical protein
MAILKPIFTVFLLFSMGALADNFAYSGTFSDLHCIESQGDILGLEVSFIAGVKDNKYQYYALVQFAEGIAAQPELQPVTITNGKFSLQANYMGYVDVTLSGEISKDGIIGTIGAPLDQSISLKRKASFWSAPGDLCFR